VAQPLQGPLIRWCQ